MGNSTKTSVAALMSILGELVALLRRYEVTVWADWLASDIERLRAADYLAIEHLLSAYGGMGSLNDVAIWAASDNPISDSEVRLANQELAALLSEAYNLARDLQTKLRSDSSSQRPPK